VRSVCGDRFPGNRNHHRDRHGFGHHSESSASNSRSRHHNRCGYVSRAEVLTGSRLTQPESKSGGSRENISRTPFSIREFIDA